MANKSSDVIGLNYRGNKGWGILSQNYNNWDTFYRDKNAVVPVNSAPLYGKSDTILSANNSANYIKLNTTNSLDNIAKQSQYKADTVSSTTTKTQPIQSVQPSKGAQIGKGVASSAVSMAMDYGLQALDAKKAEEEEAKNKAIFDLNEAKNTKLNADLNKQSANSSYYATLIERSRIKNPMLSAKNGTKLTLNSFIEKSKSLTGTKNIIPAGTLHKDKNNIGDKGIPMIDSSGQKVMEIEKGEIIFRLEATNKIQDLVKEFNESKEEGVLLHLGKYVAQELGLRTEDLTGTFSDII